MGKKRSKATTKQKRAKAAAQYKQTVVGGAFTGAVKGAKGKGQRQNIEQTTQIKLLTGRAKNNPVSAKKLQPKSKPNKFVSKWNSPNMNQSEQAEYAREHASVMERQRNEVLKQQALKQSRANNTLMQMSPATLKLEPETIEELVELTARKVQQSSIFQDAPSNFQTQSNPPPTNILANMAAQKRLETTSAEKYMLKPPTDSDPMSNNRFCAFVGHCDSDDDVADTPFIKPLMFAPPSFHFQPQTSTVPTENDVIDPDL